MAATSYLYLVFHANGLLFKVGKANNVLQRFRQLGMSSLDVKSALALEIAHTETHPADKLANYIETGILGLFGDASLSAEEALSRGAPESGKTEWYSPGAFAPMVALLQHYSESWNIPLLRAEQMNQSAVRGCMPGATVHRDLGHFSKAVTINPAFIYERNPESLRGYTRTSDGELLMMDVSPPDDWDF